MNANASGRIALTRLLILALIGLVGMVALFVVVPNLLQSTPIQTPSGPSRLLYAKTERNEKGIRTLDQLILYDPQPDIKKVIYTIPDPRRNGIRPLPSSPPLVTAHRAYASRASDGFLFVIFEFDRAGIQHVHRIVKISHEGKTQEVLRLPSNDYSELAASADQARIASLSPRCFWRIDDLATKKRKDIRHICGDAGALVGFSRDASKLYYFRGFAETIDYTEEEMRKEAQERGYGLRGVDLETGADRLLIPWSLDSYVPLFWHSPLVNREKRIFLVGKNGNAITTGLSGSVWADVLEIKQVGNPDFDYITVNDISLLRALGQFRVSRRRFQGAILSAAGDGIFYRVSPPDKPNFAGHEVGFYEIEEARDYFPLPFALGTPIPRPPFRPIQHRPELFAAISRDALFYIVGLERVAAEGRVEPVERRLYRVSADGREMLVDASKRGDFLFIGTP